MAWQVAWWSSDAAWRRPSSSASLCMWPHSWRQMYRASSRCSLTPTGLQQCPSTGPLCRGCSTGPRCLGRLWWASPPATWLLICRSAFTTRLCLALFKGVILLFLIAGRGDGCQPPCSLLLLLFSLSFCSLSPLLALSSPRLALPSPGPLLNLPQSFPSPPLACPPPPPPPPHFRCSPAPLSICPHSLSFALLPMLPLLPCCLPPSVYGTISSAQTLPLPVAKHDSLARICCAVVPATMAVNILYLSLKWKGVCSARKTWCVSLCRNESLCRGARCALLTQLHGLPPLCNLGSFLCICKFCHDILALCLHHLSCARLWCVKGGVQTAWWVCCQI